MTLRVAMAAVCMVTWAGVPMQAQVWRPQASNNPTTQEQQPASESNDNPDPDAEMELRTGTALTRHGSFAEAIPHLRAAFGRVSNEYAASFNLALCYVCTGQFEQAVQVLSSLRDSGHDNADVYNLLAQAQIGNAEPREAWESFQKAVLLTPRRLRALKFYRA